MHDEQYPIILGVYSLQQDAVVGIGGTASQQRQVTYWYARKLDVNTCEVQPLNVHHVPSGIRKAMEELEFLRTYMPEPLYYKNHTVPALASLHRKLGEGEACLAALRLDDAEKAFIKALMIDDLNVPANFGLGEVYAEKKDAARLRKVLNVLMGSDEAFLMEHRVRFNKFGISLRKNGHFDDSLRFYHKALECREDEHLHFNIARVHFDKGDTGACVDHLTKALAMRPDFTEAQRFLTFCGGRNCSGL
ncbi:tetratricopeptide repeat family protein [Desulfovibrio sp. A2]|nr:tetratricopeptide repeat family protein [Desulfovibrio sp. A2]